MKVSLDKDLVRSILIQETFYNQVPEYFFLKEAGSNIVMSISQDGSCSSCVENNLINPTVMTFISHTVNMYLDCGKESLDKFKKYVKEFLQLSESFEISVLYKENEDTEVAELLI